MRLFWCTKFGMKMYHSASVVISILKHFGTAGSVPALSYHHTPWVSRGKRRRCCQKCRAGRGAKVLWCALIIWGCYCKRGKIRNECFLCLLEDEAGYLESILINSLSWMIDFVVVMFRSLLVEVISNKDSDKIGLENVDFKILRYAS